MKFWPLQAQSSQRIRETFKSDIIYLINLGVSEVCDSQFVAPGDIEMGSAMPPRWEVCPAAARGELGPALGTSPAGTVPCPPAPAVFCTSRREREIHGYVARKKDWQEGCSSNSRETEDKLIDFLPSFLGHLTFNNIHSMHGTWEYSNWKRKTPEC